MNYKLSEIALINPKESLPSGSLAKKVAMEKLQPFCRDIDGFELTKYNGGTKFRNGDTIMARITPCLENGKIAKVNILDEKEIGFGSTEYIIFRAKPGVTDEDYLYYLITSPIVRNPAIKSMVGSSGRQRVQTDVIQNLEIDVPELPIQKKIGSILKRIDDKIELNRKINDNLYDQIKKYFIHLFIENEQSISWEKKNIGYLVENTIGGDWGKETPTGNYTEKVYCIRGADIPDIKYGNKGKMPTRFILPKNYANKKLNSGDLVVEISGGSPTQSTGRVAFISNSLLNKFNNGLVCTNFCRAVTPKSEWSLFLYTLWQYLYDKDLFFTYENGTTGIKNFDLTGFLDNEEFSVPPKELLKQFNNLCASSLELIFKNGLENERLSDLRDALLPKLMSGEIDVDSIEL